MTKEKKLLLKSLLKEYKQSKNILNQGTGIWLAFREKDDKFLAKVRAKSETEAMKKFKANYTFIGEWYVQEMDNYNKKYATHDPNAEYDRNW